MIVCKMLVIFFAILSMSLAMTTLDPTTNGTSDHTQGTTERSSVRQGRQGPGWFSTFMRPSREHICTANDGTQGVCVDFFTCRNQKGLNLGPCSDLGVCCLIFKSCDQTISINNTFFVNPDYPSPTSVAGTCSLNVERVQSRSGNICQVRLEFVSLHLDAPSKGTCVRDQFTLVPPRAPLPLLCGINDGQHVNIEHDFNKGPLTLRVALSNPADAPVVKRNWAIHVTQFECKSEMRAPKDCLQHFTNVTGVIQSFNLLTNTKDQAYLNNLNYPICIRNAEGFCGLHLTGDILDIDPSVTQTTPGAGAGEISCRQDYLLIPCGSRDGNPNNSTCKDRFCGRTLSPQDGDIAPTSVVTKLRPFRLHFVTDDEARGTSKGFSLRYSLLPCNEFTSRRVAGSKHAGF